MPGPNNNSYFTCSNCQQTFLKGRFDEEAMIESEILFGEQPKEKLKVVCDGCFDGLMMVYAEDFKK